MSVSAAHYYSCTVNYEIDIGWLLTNIGFGEALQAESYIGQFVRQYVSCCSALRHPFFDQERNLNTVL